MEQTYILILLLTAFAIIWAGITIIEKYFFTVESKQFSLTWFNSFMFFSMIGLPIYYIKYYISLKRKPAVNLEPEEIKEGQILVDNEEEKPKKKNKLLLILPCFLDSYWLCNA